MEKKIEFDCVLGHICNGGYLEPFCEPYSKTGLYVVIVPKELLSDWLIVNKGIHVTLSPACPVREPDYKAMWEELKFIYSGHKGVSWDMHNIEAKHTPQGDPTRVKKEET